MKTPGPDDWRKKLVSDSVEKKRLFGPGQPADNEVEQLVDEMEDRLACLTLFDDQEDDEEDDQEVEYMEE